MSFADIRTFGQRWINQHPAHRKITLTFTLTDESHCVASEIVDELPPSLFVIRLHRYCPNGTELTTIGAEQYRQIESEFRQLGYTVISEEFGGPGGREFSRLITGGTNAIRKKVNDDVLQATCNDPNICGPTSVVEWWHGKPHVTENGTVRVAWDLVQP